MAFSCAWPLAEDRPSMPVVFASRHGETSRSYRLLQDLAANEPLSPTSFGLSVHNAIIGQWSIIRKETEEGIALGGSQDMLEHAFLEACALIHAGAPNVLVIAAEERPPGRYLPWIDDVPFSYAVAFRLGATPQWQLRPGTPIARPHKPALPHPLSTLQQLILGTPGWEHTGPIRSWHWSKVQA
ncbi:3-oxoacyl-[ACP] synthase [plant metagenome]|uniref:3-oxoacyl-[ACP] synthase n=1 Tax=plant metagenome TaxID=1297885 RepID=A0A484SXQ6_9ZZZZ